MFANTPAGYIDALAAAGGDPRRLWIDQGLVYVQASAPSEPGAEAYASIASGLLPYIRCTTPEIHGAVSGNDQAPAVAAAIASGYLVFLSRDYSCTSLTIPTTTIFFGPGRLVARTAQGTRPTVDQLEAAGSAASRLALLQAYCPNAITLTGGQASRMDLRAHGFLIRGDAINWTILGRVELTSCAIYKASLSIVGSGYVNAPFLVSSDSINDAVLCQYGGKAVAPDAVIYKPTLNGLYVFGGGSINCDRGAVWRAGRRGVECNQGGTIYCSAGSVRLSQDANVSITYTGAIHVGGATIADSIGSAGVAAESGGAVYAENAVVTGNYLWGLTTSYTGFIQARGATITGNGRPVQTLTGGTINVMGANIDKSNNGGGIQIKATVGGFIFSEPAGTAGSGKEALSAGDYSPLYGVLGPTQGQIFEDNPST